jgi:hypothetical protein
LAVFLGRWVLEERLVMQFGGTTLALFFVLRPMFLLTFSIAIPDEHTRFTRLETNALSFHAAAIGTADDVDLVHPSDSTTFTFINPTIHHTTHLDIFM